MKLFSLSLAAVSALAFAASAQAASLLNGDFSTPTVGGSAAPLYQTFYASTSDTIGAWKVSKGNVDLIGAYWNSPAGSASVDLDGFNPGAISQAITGLTPGQHFDVKFSFSGNPGGDPIKTLMVTLDGGSMKTLTFNTTAEGNSTANMGWKSESLAFTATSGLNLLEFASGDENQNSRWGPAIASISIAAPEPATWAMMLIGFGGLGAALRMYRRRTAVAAA
jgi:choice-of-anchor C domain-containing protein